MRVITSMVWVMSVALARETLPAIKTQEIAPQYACDYFNSAVAARTSRAVSRFLDTMTAVTATILLVNIYLAWLR